MSQYRDSLMLVEEDRGIRKKRDGFGFLDEER